MRGYKIMLVNFKSAFRYFIWRCFSMKWRMSVSSRSLNCANKKNKKIKLRIKIYGTEVPCLSALRYCGHYDEKWQFKYDIFIGSARIEWLAQIEKIHHNTRQFIRWLFLAAFSLSKQLASASIYGNNKRKRTRKAECERKWQSHSYSVLEMSRKPDRCRRKKLSLSVT